MTVETRFGKITASKETLNELSIALNFALEYLATTGRKGFIKDFTDASDNIYDALEASGYYEN